MDTRIVARAPRPEDREKLSTAPGRLALVQGWVQRDPATGRPVAIDPVCSVELLPDAEPGSYRRARAVAPPRLGAPAPEVAIGRIRDA